MTARHTGTLKDCKTDKGHGLVTCKGYERDIIVRKSNMPGKQQPRDNQVIEFSVFDKEDGNFEARDIKLLPESGAKPSARFQRAAAPTSQSQHPTTPNLRCSAQASKSAPYTFVPVDVRRESDGFTYPTARMLSVPGHDGSNADARFSGKLKLTLTTHTPLLVGGRHFTLPPQDRSIIEPWRLDEPDGRVVLAGSSLKGMLRHYLSALLNAPMERVYEQYFSYRPNLDLPNSRDRTRLEVREAVIESAPDDNGNGMRVKILSSGRQAIFVRSEALGSIRFRFDEILPSGTDLPGIKFDPHPRARRIEPNGPGWKTDREYQLARYSGGMSGIVDSQSRGQFSRLHEDRSHDNQQVKITYLYKAVLVPTNGRSKSKDIHRAVVEGYRRTQQELADTKHGHCSSRNANIGTDAAKGCRASDSLKDATALRLLQPGNMIYVEVEVDNSDRIVSFGHHFRYRWGYRDTIRKTNRLAGQGNTRAELSMHYDEGVGIDKEGHVGNLSAARALFGYAADASIHDDVFAGSFQRLAGRISINHALEVIDEGQSALDNRFIHHDGSPLFPLKELGSPKASAAEFYIQQRNADNRAGQLTTYGDLPLKRVEETRLSGRKFYRHQPLAAESGSPYLAQTPEERQNSRASLAHCASKPGTHFRFTLRFQDLCKVELGAVLFVLGIQHADQFLAEEKPSKEFEEFVNTPNYALKLGYARPLGLGSVTCALDGVELLECRAEGTITVVSMQPVENPAEWRQSLVKAFLDKKVEDADLAPHLNTCLDAWSYAGRRDAAYPRKDGEIYKFHTDLRRHHAKARRLCDGAESIEEHTDLVKPAFGQGGDRQ